MRSLRLGLLGAASDLDGARQRQQLEPGQRVAEGPRFHHAPFGECSEGAKRGRWMPCLHGSGGSPPEMKLRRRVVSMAAWAGAPVGGDDALLLEVAHHPGRQADRLAGRPDARQLVSFVVDRLAWHATQSTTTMADTQSAIPAPARPPGFPHAHPEPRIDDLCGLEARPGSSASLRDKWLP